MRTLQTQTVTVTIAEHQLNHVATFFIQKANSFKSQISVAQGDNSVNAKSLLGIMSLSIVTGATVTLYATGSDAEAAIEALDALLQRDVY